MYYACVLCTVGEVILGWDVAVATMKKSELARILVAPKYAFGSMGCPPRIPPNSTSKFMHIRILFCFCFSLTRWDNNIRNSICM